MTCTYIINVAARIAYTVVENIAYILFTARALKTSIGGFKTMNEPKICIDLVIGVLKALQNKCKTHEYCSEKICKLYNRNEATCFLRAYPCDYDLQEIEKQLIEIIRDELKDGETK